MEDLLSQEATDGSVTSRLRSHKRAFQEKVVKAYYDVESLLALEEKILQLSIDPNNSTAIDNLRSTRNTLQKNIDDELKDGGLYRSLVMEEYKARKNENCGHLEQCDDKCDRCMQSKLLIMDYSRNIERWLDIILPRSRFTMLIFYRGTWCGNCAVYLQEVNQIIRDLRALGGEAYGICSQEARYTERMKSDTNLDFELLSDPELILAKKFDIKISKKHGRAFNVMSRIIQSALGNTDTYEPYHNNGISQPAIVLLDSQGSIMYRWVSPVQIKTGFGMFNRANPYDVVKLVRFYYGQKTLFDSVLQYTQENSHKIFDMVLADANLRSMFMKYLQKEYSSESLEFLEYTELFAGKIYKRNKKVTELEQCIYDVYIIEKSDKALNIPNSLRKQVTAFLTRKDAQMVTKFEEHIYHNVYLFVRNMLRTDSFTRFIRQEEFFNAMLQAIPQTYYVK
jgi:peroxiredoxin